MASASSPALPPQVITITPLHAFAQICGYVKGLENGREVTLPTQTTVKEAVALLSQETTNLDDLMSFSEPRTEQHRERMRMLARTMFGRGEPSSPLRIQNAVPAAEHPAPEVASSAVRAAVKQLWLGQQPFRDPYPVSLCPNVDEGLLAAVSARMRFRVIDGGEHI